MKLYKGLLGLALVFGLSACTSDDTKDEDTDDTDDSDTDIMIAECEAGGTVTIGGETYNIALDGLSILGANPNLTAGGMQPFTAETCDWTFGDNLLNIFQTAVEGDISVNGWDEEHVIPSTASTQGDATTPRLDHLELAMAHVDTIGELTDDTKTLFNSDDMGGLTYVLRVYGTDSSLADCIIWGHNTAAVFSGQVSSWNTHTSQSEISSSNCADLSR